MKDIYLAIKQYEREFAKQEIFSYIQDNSLSIQKRISWVPCLTHIAMGFADVWKYNFRKEPTENELQKLINQHTYEDENHWIWFIHDLKKLGFDKQIYFSESLMFLWGEETTKVRLVPHLVAVEVHHAEPIVKLAALEAIESTFHIFISATAPIMQQLREQTQENYHYIGATHFEVEDSHTIRTKEMHKKLYDMELSLEQKNKSLQIVDTVFTLFTSGVEQMLNFSQKEMNVLMNC